MLVALAIAAMGLGALMAAAGQGLQNVSAADTYIEATRRARTHLDMVGVIKPAVEGDLSGDDGGGYAWRLHIAPVGVRPPPQDVVQTAPPLTLYDVFVTIAWKSGTTTRNVTVQSRRLGRLGQP